MVGIVGREGREGSLEKKILFMFSHQYKLHYLMRGSLSSAPGMPSSVAETKHLLSLVNQVLRDSDLAWHC